MTCQACDNSLHGIYRRFRSLRIMSLLRYASQQVSQLSEHNVRLCSASRGASDVFRQVLGDIINNLGQFVRRVIRAIYVESRDWVTGNSRREKVVGVLDASGMLSGLDWVTIAV